MDTAPDNPDEISLTLMGTGTSVGVPVVTCECHVCLSDDPKNKRLRTSVLVQAPEGKFLIDTSPDLRQQLLRERIDHVHAAIYTHAHADHIYGLDELRLFGHRADRDIPLYCERNVEEVLRSAFWYAFEEGEGAHRWAKPRLSFRTFGPEPEPFSLLGLSIVPIRLFHGSLPLLGYRFGDVAFCTDVNRIPEESWPLLEDLDTLVLTALRHTPHPTHFSIDEALEVVDRVRPNRTFFTHVSHELDHRTTSAALPEGIELAYDGLTIPIGASARVEA